MIEIVKKVVEAERQLAIKNGQFIFFGLFKRIDLEDKWDVVASGDWIDENSVTSFSLIDDELKKQLKDKINLIARIILLNPKDEFIKSVLSENLQLWHCAYEIKNQTIGKSATKFEHAYLIALQKSLKDVMVAPKARKSRLNK